MTAQASTWDPDDVVGIKEIAERHGTSKGTVRSWRYRYPDFPVPVAELAMGPAWRWGDVVPFLAQRGRRA